jgi:UDP-N-acetylmuramate: L-alanyl-gamma-D-glutamyl-meso-diaminopimelate ligase
MNDLPKAGSHIHLIAICGVGMASLAGLLQARGYRVTGSDQNIYPPMSTYLGEIGIAVQAGFRPEHIRARPDLAVIGNAVTRDNPEAQAVLAGNIPYISFPQALGSFLIGPRMSTVVAGTHGKTSTAALAAWVWSVAGLDPGFFVGGVPINFGSGWKVGAGNHVIIEGDEYDTAFFDKGPKFLHYRPGQVILTSIEFDHADIYRDLAHVKSAFLRLIEIIPSDGCLVVCSDYRAALEVSAAAGCRTITYGDAARADWNASAVEFRAGRAFFTPCYRGKAEERIEAAVIGRHNVNNALAVYALGRLMGVESATLQEGLRSFAGVKRRQEIRGESRGVVVIDDFAHHPTAVRETIEAVRAAYPRHTVWAVFEPRSNTSKRNIFEREFAEALALADKVLVAPVYQPEKVAADERLTVENVVRAIDRLRGKACARAVSGVPEIARRIGEEAQAGDVILVMSNGGFDNVHQKILQALAA